MYFGLVPKTINLDKIIHFFLYFTSFETHTEHHNNTRLNSGWLSQLNLTLSSQISQSFYLL